MSIEVIVMPVLADIAILTSILVEAEKRARITLRSEKGILSQEQIDEILAEGDSLKQAGHDFRQGTSAQTNGADVLIDTGRGYSIGIKRGKKGACEVVTHWAEQPGKAEMRQVSSDIESRIKQKYAYEKVKRELAKKGFTVATEEVEADDSIRLIARKW